GGSGQDQVVRASSLAEFRAAFLRDLLSGRAGGRWEDEEVDDLLRLPAAEAAVSLLLNDPPQVVPAPAALDPCAPRERLLAPFDGVALERLFAAIAGAGAVAPAATLTPADLLWAVGQALAAPPHGDFAPAGRRQALRLFVRTGGAAGRPPRLIFHALLALTCL